MTASAPDVAAQIPDVLIAGTAGFDRLHFADGRDSGWQLGGSAPYAAVAAAQALGGMSSVGLLAVVGDDFPTHAIARFHALGVATDGLERRPGPTFRWEASYSPDLDTRQTLCSLPGVMAGAAATIPSAWRKSPLTALYLACDDPIRQSVILASLPPPVFTAMDTMALWIRTRRDALVTLLPRVDLFLANESEARLLLSAPDNISIPELGQQLLRLGAARAVVKCGSRGAVYADAKNCVPIPPVPLPPHALVDATGAGDAFGGALAVSVAATRKRDQPLREAIIQALPRAARAGSNACRHFGPWPDSANAPA